MNGDMMNPKDVEQALRESEARLHEAQAVGRMGDWELNRDTGAMSWSPQLFRLFERDPASGPPDLNEVLAYYSSESLEDTREAFWHAIDAGERGQLEQTVSLPSGGERYHITRIVPVKDRNGRVFKLYGTTQDITECKLAEKEVRRRKREIEDLYENAPCGYHSVDPEGRVIHMNDTQLRWLGYTRSEAVGCMHARELFSPASRRMFEPIFESFKKTGVLHNVEMELQRKDGSALPVLMSATAIFDAEGKFVGSRTVVVDNSDRKELERERAAHAARLADLSRHMVDVQEHERHKLAGELHSRASPNLAALQLTLTNLARALPASLKAQLEPLLDDARALLLDTSAGIRDICTNLRPATLDYAGLVPALEEYAEQFQQRTRVAISVDTAGFDLELPTNLQSLLFRIVQEALTNAAKHARANRIEVRLASDDECLTLRIADDGVGFTPQNLGTPGAKPGLGLITMRERAEFAGGRFTVRSSDGAGTEITVSFDHDADHLRAAPRQKTIDSGVLPQADKS